MKIVSIMTTASQGGAEFAAVSLLDALAGAGHETVILSNQAGISRDSRVRERHLELGPKLSVATYPRLAATAPLLLGRMARALRSEAPYDALLVHFKKEQLLAAALPRRMRPRLLWAEWGPVPVPMRHGVANRAYRRAAAPVTAVLAISAGTRASVIEAGVDAARVHVVPNVMDVEGLRPDAEEGRRFRASLGIPPEAFVVACSSRFHPKKRNDVLVAAALEVAADRAAPPLHLVLGGDGETEGELRTQAAPLGDAAHFVPTPTANLRAFLSASDVVAFCPSPTEGAPRAIIAAMLAERPVVATAAEGASGLIPAGAGEIAAPDNDPRATAALLRRYRDEPDLARAHGAAARLHAAATHDPAVITAQVALLLRAASRR